MTTEVGRIALAQRDASAAARDFDYKIEARLQELLTTDPVLRALTALRRFALALPSELLARGWTPLLVGPDEITWRAPSE
jgi:hypothetical protein